MSNTKFPGQYHGSSGGGSGSGGGGASRNVNVNVSNNQLLRHLYLTGTVHALRLNYSQAYSALSQCLRKIDIHSTSKATSGIVGFQLSTTKLLIVVQLLMGEIPERSMFTSSKTKSLTLEPYLHMTQAVRRGDLAIFEDMLKEHKAVFQKDERYSLIARLSHSVVKAGLRKLVTSYSRIPLSDVAMRLSLPSIESATFIVAKAIQDGVIDATITHTSEMADGVPLLESNELLDVYSTMEPADAFHRRIAYCLDVHNEAVRALRYPADEYKKKLLEATTWHLNYGSRGKKKKKKKGKEGEEDAKSMDEEEEDDDDDDDDFTDDDEGF